MNTLIINLIFHFLHSIHSHLNQFNFLLQLFKRSSLIINFHLQLFLDFFRKSLITKIFLKALLCLNVPKQPEYYSFKKKSLQYTLLMYIQQKF